MRLAIRVDASTEIGSGHVRRCISLAQAARELGASVTFVSRALDFHVAALVQRHGWPLMTLPAPQPGLAPAALARPIAHARWAGVDPEVDARETIQALGGRPFDWVLVDHYSFGASWHRRVRQGCGARIAAIDDLADRDMDVDLIIDHNHAASHPTKYRDVNLGAATILGGPAYALLDAAYANAPRYAFSAEVRSIGVFMGGADAGNYSARAVLALRDLLGFGGPVQVATTSSNPHLAALQGLARRHPATSVTVDRDNLSGFFAAHDLQVGAGGGATWERCCIGVPSTAIVVADNQRQVLEPLQSRDVLHMVPEIPPSTHDLARALGELIADSSRREQLAASSRRLVDGQGATRVAHHLFHACTL